MKPVIVTYDMPSHEGEYVVLLPMSESEARKWAKYQREHGRQNDPRYAELKKHILEFSNYEAPGSDLDNYDVLDRGTRVEIVGPRDDALIHGMFNRLGYEVIDHGD